MQEKSTRLGSLLRDAMEQRNYSIRQLAELTSIDKATVSRIMNGKRKPTLQHLKKLSAALEIPFNDLVEAIDYEADTTASRKKHGKQSHSGPIPAAEVELLQKSIQLHEPSITIDKLAAELETFEEYTKTHEGKSMVKDGFDAKVNHFGNVGTYIQQLKIWHRKFLLAEGSKKELAVMGGALLYFILPLDLLHDYIFAVGYLDDCLAIQLAGNKLENKI
ncbi:helix-turn-helix domain-containing protein [Planomicrobium sp. CPCC 101110]|uniref:helix-turn-helix domain-containing protein n=1 Tax=Planomicrobium sp. CPCC 101110 TaxID=2599619 RepID=UPI0011B525D6|nr:helix-turn-helix domain-containing protein [Planomicrobium sp. CPCC 101110]TWT26000.1 helix-turn-helix domain-containing protein [Planomicrobium sp. CPCC 101110]